MFYNQNFYEYPNMRADTYNYVNNNYNQPMYEEDANANKLYDPYQGFIRGNMFPNLYNGYGKTLDIKPLNQQAKMLTTLDALDFAAHDIALYLDLHPEDRDMIQLYNSYRMQANELRENYEKKYGPILASSNATNKYPWDWNDKPWPWENKEV